MYYSQFVEAILQYMNERIKWLEIASTIYYHVQNAWLPSVMKWLDLSIREEQQNFSTLNFWRLLSWAPTASLHPVCIIQMSKNCLYHQVQRIEITEAGYKWSSLVIYSGTYPLEFLLMKRQEEKTGSTIIRFVIDDSLEVQLIHGSHPEGTRQRKGSWEHCENQQG